MGRGQLAAKPRQSVCADHVWRSPDREVHTPERADPKPCPGAGLCGSRPAAESGQVVNYSSISQQAGISQHTVKSHYELLEDMFIGFRIPAFSGSARKGLLSTPRFCFFDLGVRHAAAGIVPSRDTVLADPGPIFEQWAGIELWKRLQYQQSGQISYLRTKSGAEIDFIIEQGGSITPIEVKWTDRPSLSDARHLLTFLKEQGAKSPHGYIICRCPLPMQLHPQVTALPWHCL